MIAKIATAVVVTALFLTGCTTTQDAPETAPELTTDERYLANVEDQLPKFKGADEDMLIDAGHRVCDFFDEYGVSNTTLLTLVEAFESNFTTEETAAIVIVSTDAYCPEIKDDIMGLANGGSAA